MFEVFFLKNVTQLYTLVFSKHKIRESLCEIFAGLLIFWENCGPFTSVEDKAYEEFDLL